MLKRDSGSSADRGSARAALRVKSDVLYTVKEGKEGFLPLLLVQPSCGGQPQSPMQATSASQLARHATGWESSEFQMWSGATMPH